MIDSKIPRSVQEILDEYIRYNFFKISYKRLARALNMNVDTIIQRISRNKEYFEIDDSERPSKISIKKGIKDVYFYRDKNKCQICQKQKNPNDLNLRFRNPFQKDKYDWQNVLSVCNDCKDKDIVKIKKQVKIPSKFEYKEVQIHWTSKKEPEINKWEYYLEFDELDGSGYFPLLDEQGDIASNNVADILNYFATDRWELVHINVSKESEYELEEYQVFFKRKITN